MQTKILTYLLFISFFIYPLFNIYRITPVHEIVSNLQTGTLPTKIASQLTMVSPAISKMGLQVGDSILKIDNKIIDHQIEIRELLSKKNHNLFAFPLKEMARILKSLVKFRQIFSFSVTATVLHFKISLKLRNHQLK